MITSSLLKDFKSIRHGFYTRQGGHSTGVFASLNCGYGSGDDKDIVQKNRASAMEHIEFDEHDLVTVYQTHSAKVATVTEAWRYDDAPHVDAMVTNQPGIALGILTADCAPVLLADAVNQVIGAAHAGWRGAKSGILKQTIKAMEKIGAEASNIAGAVGPCIRQDSYEVRDVFRSAFIEDDHKNESYFVPSSREDHYQFDLPGYIEDQLTALSISQVDILPFDTYSDEDLFFSFRRTTHQEKEQYGRALSAIGLKSTQE